MKYSPVKISPLFLLMETKCYICTRIQIKARLMKLKVVLMEEADAFMYSLPRKAYQEVVYNLLKVENGILDKELFKKLENTEIWELRTLFNGLQYRLFAFWDTEECALVIATHGIVKKTQKTPAKEIAKAEKIRKEYFYHKRQK